MINKTLNKDLAAVCGLFCPSCAIYIATNEDPERLAKQAKSLGLSIEETKCNGCRSDRLNANCQKCFILKCANEKGIDFCVDCESFPCNELQEFQSKMPHRTELWKDLENIKKNGWENWYMNQFENYSCNECGTLNSGWDISCRQCGNSPSCSYIKNNIEEIKNRME